MSEDVIWQILDEQFCSFKAKFDKKSFCKNEYNLTGMCNKMYCPLANGRYATIREEDGVLYLHIKTIERAHTPANLWEKIQLPEDMGGALAIINENLAFWPRRFVNKVKERLVRLHQYLIRYRKWYYRAKPRLVTVHKKFERREQNREAKALVAAKIDHQILQELDERMKQGIYEEFINLNNNAYQELLREHKRREQKAKGHRKSKEDKEEEGESTTTTVTAEEDEVDFSQGLAFTEDDIEDEEDDEGLVDLEDVEEQEEEEEEEPEIELDLNDEEHSELNALKKRLMQHRKRKADLKNKKEHKKSKTKRTKYGPTVEIEYENTPQVNTTSSYAR